MSTLVVGLLLLMPQVAVAQKRAPATGVVGVTVTETQTALGWYYEYEVTNLSKAAEVRLIWVQAKRRKSAGPRLPLTLSAPTEWDVTRAWDTGTQAARWAQTPIVWMKKGSAGLKPGATLGGLTALYETRCVWCTDAAFVAELSTDRSVEGAVDTVSGPSSSTPLRVTVSAPPSGAKITGVVRLGAVISDPARGASLNFDVMPTGRISRVSRIAVDPAGSFEATWNTRASEGDGECDVRAVVQDAEGRTYKSEFLTFDLVNGLPSSRRPMIIY